MGVNYRKALNPTQAKEMNQFLRILLGASDKAKECGVKPNLDNFMRSWIGLPVTAKGKKQQHAYNTRKRYWKKNAARGYVNAQVK